MNYEVNPQMEDVANYLAQFNVPFKITIYIIYCINEYGKARFRKIERVRYIENKREDDTFTCIRTQNNSALFQHDTIYGCGCRLIWKICK